MKLFRDFRSFVRPKGGTVVTIGVFDGVHLGHRKVIEKCVKRARRLKLKSAVLTFDPHPLKVLYPGSRISSLISLAHRIRLIGEMGADFTLVLNFTRHISNLKPEKFVGSILSGKLGAGEVYVGENFYFGRKAKAGISVLKVLGRKFGLKVRIIRPVKAGRRIVSSSVIRRAITKGDLRRAERLLGRPVSILGTVVGGANLARELGYPTANINPHHEVIPPSGVYAVRAAVGSRRYQGVLNIGKRPTFYSPRDMEPAIEVHIFDFHRRIYGRDIEVFFIKKLREEVKFKTKEGLIQQIREDEKKARHILSYQ